MSDITRVLAPTIVSSPQNANGRIRVWMEETQIIHDDVRTATHKYRFWTTLDDTNPFSGKFFINIQFQPYGKDYVTRTFTKTIEHPNIEEELTTMEIDAEIDIPSERGVYFNKVTVRTQLDDEFASTRIIENEWALPNRFFSIKTIKGREEFQYCAFRNPEILIADETQFNEVLESLKLTFFNNVTALTAQEQQSVSVEISLNSTRATASAYYGTQFYKETLNKYTSNKTLTLPAQKQQEMIEWLYDAATDTIGERTVYLTIVLKYTDAENNEVTLVNNNPLLLRYVQTEPYINIESIEVTHDYVYQNFTNSANKLVENLQNAYIRVKAYPRNWHGKPIVKCELDESKVDEDVIIKGEITPIDEAVYYGLVSFQYKIVFNAEDGSGNTTSKEITKEEISKKITVIEWEKPRIYGMNAKIEAQEDVLNISGTLETFYPTFEYAENDVRNIHIKKLQMVIIGDELEQPIPVVSYEPAAANYIEYTDMGQIFTEGNLRISDNEEVYYSFKQNVDINEYQLNYEKNFKLEVTIEDNTGLAPIVMTFPIISQPIFDWSQNDFRFRIPVVFDKGFKSYPTILNDGDNCAYQTESGEFYCPATVDDKPTEESGWLTVKAMADRTHVYQEFVTDRGTAYRRVLSPETLWSEWNNSLGKEMFKVTRVYTPKVSTTTTYNQTQSATEEGYYPLCVSGYAWDSSTMATVQIRLTDQDDGFTNVNAYGRKVSGSDAVTTQCIVYVLWLKI